jgi:hypothetical protein
MADLVAVFGRKGQAEKDSIRVDPSDGLEDLLPILEWIDFEIRPGKSHLDNLLDRRAAVGDNKFVGHFTLQ